ncbi:hypothetical protein [Amycolatopsis sp. NPDC051061]|uniref:hypothetical protein n=1 Tax=Amycolatopsis sp. NPDC051061 TaxID=3155042 RepID=UPI00341762AF
MFNAAGRPFTSRRFSPTTGTAGASDVITRTGLRARVDGEDPTDDELELIAATLTTAVVQRGG